MALQNELVRQGGWLFRWRSYLPLGILALVLLSLVGAPFPFRSELAERSWELFCLAVSLSGLAVRAYAVGTTPSGTSGRNTRKQVADELNTSGLYSVVRHPLYLGNFLLWMGVALLPCIWWLPLLVGLAFALYHERIMAAEEAFLREKFGDAFTRWAERTPAFIPALGQWRAPALPFCLRTVLRREYSGLFGMIAAFAVVDGSWEWLAGVHRGLDELWVVLFAAGLLAYVVLRTLKRKTRVLHVSGR